mgnify:CR=1 FL=1
MAKPTARTVDTSPYWLESAPLPRFPKLDRDAGADVVIVGGGITGLTAAYLLATAGKSVVVLERGRCAQIDSGHTSAHLTMVTDTGRTLGTVTEIISTPANDVWAATDEHGVETLIPVIDDVLLSVDIPGGTITVRETPGITTPE